MIVMGNRSTWRKTCPSGSLPATYPSIGCQRIDLGFCSKQMAPIGLEFFIVSLKTLQDSF
jgi:hypothetical protein